MGPSENKADEAAETVQKGTMPPWFYIALHPSAKLSPSERQELITGLIATFAVTSERSSELLSTIVHTQQDRPELVDSAKLVAGADALHDLVVQLDQTKGTQQ